MGKRQKLLNWLDSQVGTQGGSKYWYDVYGWSGNGLPWCAVFVSDAFKQTGIECAYFPSTVAFDKRDKDRIGSAWLDPYHLEAGCPLAFDWNGDGGGDHVGFVREVLGYGYYKTIEGNVSDSCGVRYRRVSDGIIGGIMPKFDDEVFKDVTPSTPHYEDIVWMKETGISKGYPDGTYRPNSALTRADAAAFLHRLYKLIVK